MSILDWISQKIHSLPQGNPILSAVNSMEDTLAPHMYRKMQQKQALQERVQNDFNRIPQQPVDIANSWATTLQHQQLNDADMMPQVTPTPTVQQPTQKTGNPLLDIILPITRTYNLPDNVVAGMYAAEGRDTSMGAKRNNYFNMGAVDNNPQNAFDYVTPEEGVRAYAKFLMEQPTWANGRKNEVPQYISDPLTGLKQIEEQGYAGDKNTYKQRANNGFDRYCKFVTSTPEWRQYNGG